MVVRAERSEPPPTALSYEGFDYEAFWREPGRSHLDRSERRAVARLLPRSGGRLLDAGCGFGRLTGAYLDRFEEVVLLDGAWSLLEQARQRWGSRVRLIAADLRALPFAPGSFDAAVLVRVLHHFERPLEVLRPAQEILAPQGTLVFNVGNKRNLRRIGRRLLGGRGPSPFAPGLEPYGPRSFGWHPRDVERLLGDAGFRVEELLGLGVMDKVAAHAGALAPAVPSGLLAGRALGRMRIAPILFGSAVPEPTIPRPAREDDTFRCPRCRGRLTERNRAYTCGGCGHRFPVRDGIADFRIRPEVGTRAG
ncbi:MAG TPA: methyltransferase domain-containing protein [Actinomycetota bacterium]